MWATREKFEKWLQGQNLPAEYEGSLAPAIHHWLQWRNFMLKIANKTAYKEGFFHVLKKWATVALQDRTLTYDYLT